MSLFFALMNKEVKMDSINALFGFLCYVEGKHGLYDRVMKENCKHSKCEHGGELKNNQLNTEDM